MQLSKYSASGNDFVIFHTFQKADRSALAKELCHRFNGVGADGLIVLVPHQEYDFEWEFYNADGSDAAMCGNGTRAAAHYAFKEGLASQNQCFLTGAGVIHARVDGDIVESELTPPKILNESFHEENREWFFVDTGVPHLVTEISDYSAFDKELARTMRYRHNANVNFVLKEENVLRVRTYERGVEDETLACGTGMAAAFLMMYRKGDVETQAMVYPTSGEELSLRIEDTTLFFKGAVCSVFSTLRSL